MMFAIAAIRPVDRTHAARCMSTAVGLPAPSLIRLGDQRAWRASNPRPFGACKHPERPRAWRCYGHAPLHSRTAVVASALGDCRLSAMPAVAAPVACAGHTRQAACVPDRPSSLCSSARTARLCAIPAGQSQPLRSMHPFPDAVLFAAVITDTALPPLLVLRSGSGAPFGALRTLGLSVRRVGASVRARRSRRPDPAGSRTSARTRAPGRARGCSDRAAPAPSR